MKKVFKIDDSSNLKNAVFMNSIDNQQSILLKTINQEFQANIFENIPRTSTFSKHLKQQLNQETQIQKKEQTLLQKKERRNIRLPKFNGEVKWPFFSVQQDASIKHFWNRRSTQEQSKKWLTENILFQNIMLRIGKKKKNVKGYYFKITNTGVLMYFKKESDSYPKGYIELSYKNRAILSYQKTKRNEELPTVRIERIDGIGITIFDHQNELTFQFFESIQEFCLVKGYQYVYEEIETLGSGAFATVYKVQRKRDNEIFAAKTITKDMFDENKHKEKFIQMVYNEVIALKSLDHIGIERIYEVYQEKEKLIIIIEYCSGGTLYQYFKSKERLTEKNIAFILKSISEPLFLMHSQGFVHRDLKLENIMIESKEIFQIKLVDFGFSEKINEEQLLSKSGTPGFLPPEIFKGQPYTARSDVFSLGVILYILTAGYAPFRGRPSQIQILNQKCQISFDKSPWPDISQDLKYLVKRMLEIKPDDRPYIAEILDSQFILHNIKNTSETNYKSYPMLSALDFEKNKSPNKSGIKNSESGGSRQSKEFQLDFSVHTNDIKSLYQKNSIKTMKTMQSQKSKKRQSIKQSQKLKQSVSVNKKSDVEKYQEKRKQSHPDRSSHQKEESDFLNGSFGDLMKEQEKFLMKQSQKVLTTFIDSAALTEEQRDFLHNKKNIFNQPKKPQ